MTTALCLYCGNLKHGAFLPCGGCHYEASGNRQLDIAFSDHYLTEDTLRAFGRVIQCLCKNATDDVVAGWAFMRHISEYYPEIISFDIPRKFASQVNDLLVCTPVPEVVVEDSPRLDSLEEATLDSMFMSRVRHHKATCQSCNHVQSFPVWSRISIGLDSWLIPMMTSGQLFQSVCRSCGIRQEMPYDTLFLHATKQIAIWLHDQTSDPEMNVPVPDARIYEALEPSFDCREAQYLLELLEKFQMYLNGHDDILVELVKTVLCIRNDIDLGCLMLYKDTVNHMVTGKELVFLCSSEEGAKKISYSLREGGETLLQIAKQVRQVLAEMPVGWHQVNKMFVMSAMEEAGIMKRLDI